MLRRMFIHINAVLLGGLLPVYATGQTLPRGFEIIDITRDNGVFERSPMINAQGDVVFFSDPSPTGGEIWLYEKASDTLMQITDDDVFDGLPDIADDGTIVWCRWVGPDVGNGPTPEIFMRTPDAVITQLTDDPEEDVSPSINSYRQIVWQKMGSTICGPVMDIYLYENGRSRAITTNGLPDALANQSPSISDSGDIVWTEYDFCDPPPGYNFRSRIMLHSDGRTRPLPLIGVAPQAPDINDEGAVCWNGFDPVLLRDTIELWDGETTTLVTDDGSVPSINNSRDITFSRWDVAAGLWRIWLFRDGAFQLIAGDEFHNAASRINDQSEITWGFGAEFLNFDVRLMRRFDHGDLNCDGHIDAFDIEPFIFALFDPGAYLVRYPTCDPLLADLDESGAVDALDIEPFLSVLFP